MRRPASHGLILVGSNPRIRSQVVEILSLCDMICQLCLGEAATERVTERLPSGRSREAQYCWSCYEARYLKPPPAGSHFPRLAFRLKNVMIHVAVWAVPNAVAAWIMRSGWVTG